MFEVCHLRFPRITFVGSRLEEKSAKPDRSHISQLLKRRKPISCDSRSANGSRISRRSRVVRERFSFDTCDGFGLRSDEQDWAILQTSADHKMVYGSFEATREALWKTMTGDPDRFGKTPYGYEALLEIPGDETQGYDLLPAARNHWSFSTYNELRKKNCFPTAGRPKFEGIF
jgi:hypothetical protein